MRRVAGRSQKFGHRPGVAISIECTKPDCDRSVTRGADTTTTHGRGPGAGQGTRREDGAEVQAHPAPAARGDPAARQRRAVSTPCGPSGSTYRNTPIYGEQPSMVAAADSPLIDQPKLQGRAAVRAVQFQQPNDTGCGTEHYQLLAQDRHPTREIAQLVGPANRLPEAPQVFAAGRAGTDLGQPQIWIEHGGTGRLGHERDIGQVDGDDGVIHGCTAPRAIRRLATMARQSCASLTRECTSSVSRCGWS